jgi:hypothetical protein
VGDPREAIARSIASCLGAGVFARDAWRVGDPGCQVDSLTNFAPTFSLAALLALGLAVTVFLGVCVIRAVRRSRARGLLRRGSPDHDARTQRPDPVAFPTVLFPCRGPPVRQEFGRRHRVTWLRLNCAARARPLNLLLSMPRPLRACSDWYRGDCVSRTAVPTGRRRERPRHMLPPERAPSPKVARPKPSAIPSWFQSSDLIR